MLPISHDGAVATVAAVAVKQLPLPRAVGANTACGGIAICGFSHTLPVSAGPPAIIRELLLPLLLVHTAVAAAVIH